MFAPELQIMADYKSQPTEAQLEILQLLWQHQPCTVRFLHEKISEQRELGYTTILKQVQRMQDDGLLKRSKGPGKSYVYEAAEPAAHTRDKVLNRVVKNAFGDSVSEMMLHALGNGEISPEEIEQIKALLNKIDR